MNSYSISTEYANRFSEYQDFDFNSSFVLLFFKTDAYLKNNNSYIRVESYDDIYMRDEFIEEYSKDLYCQVNAIANITPNQETLMTAAYQSLGVAQISQPTSYTCWAASMASILRYYGYSSASVSNVCSTTGQSLYTYCSASQCANWFSNKYYLTWGNQYGSYGYYSSIYLSYVVNEILNGRPMFAGFSSPSLTVGHAVVIQGYVILDSGYSTVSYMNPTNGTYVAAAVSDTSPMSITISGVTTNTVAAFNVHW